MQYFKPEGAFFVGDCMAYSHGEVFHLFYLLDQKHHQDRGGLGGHQWAHLSTRNLVDWQQHPLAVALTDDWEASICTGSVIYHNGTHHAFYATRKADLTQHLSHATSRDGVTFTKTAPNPFASAPEGYSPVDFRDPVVFADARGRFHMLVTSRIDDYPLFDRGGCLLRLSSEDMENWRVESPFLIPGGPPGYACIPECPDYFYWNGWYYLVFGLALQTHYRMSREPFGPWCRPNVDTVGNAMLAVMKTAPFGRDRRIGVGWIGTRTENRDSGTRQWAGNAVFRELVQNADGTLGTRFPPEMMPFGQTAVVPALEALTTGVQGTAHHVEADGRQTQQVAALGPMPADYRLRVRILPGGDTARYGLGLRGSGHYAAKYDLVFEAAQRRVLLGEESIDCVDGLDRPFDLDVVLKDDIIDVCVAERRCLINRLGELTGDRLFLFCENGSVAFEDLEITLLS